MPGSIDETAEAVTARGGEGIAVRCDHTVDNDVESLFQRVREEQGRLDLLVNNVWGGYEQYEFERFSSPFWEQPLRHWHGMFEAGLRAHLVASRYAVPLMLPQHRGLIINTVAWDRDLYLGNLFYDVAKAAIVRMAYGMAEELRHAWRGCRSSGTGVCAYRAGDGSARPAALPTGPHRVAGVYRPGSRPSGRGPAGDAEIR